jgi:hypothetical protein
MKHFIEHEIHFLKSHLYNFPCRYVRRGVDANLFLLKNDHVDYIFEDAPVFNLINFYYSVHKTSIIRI